MLLKLGILKEKSSKIVPIVPKSVEELSQKAKVFVEENLGEELGYTNEEYINAGANIISNKEDLMELSDVILAYNIQSVETIVTQEKTLIGYYNVLNDYCNISPFLGSSLDVYSLDLIPRTSIAQAMDISTSLASIQGYQAIITAAELSSNVFPMMTCAGGTLKPLNVLILGAGVAGLQAIATAKRLGAVVKAFDVRSSTKTEVESLGAKFIELEGASGHANNGGYALEQSKEFLDNLSKAVAKEAKNVDVIVTTAKVPGKKAPILITEETISEMKSGSIIIDLAAENGGNCQLTKNGSIVVKQGVTIYGLNDLVQKSKFSYSQLLSNNFKSFINYYLNNREQLSDEILNSTKVICKGQLVNKKILNEINNL